MKRNVRASKFEPFVDEVELLSANPQYAFVRLQNGKETTVSPRQLAPIGKVIENGNSESTNQRDPKEVNLQSNATPEEPVTTAGDLTGPPPEDGQPVTVESCLGAGSRTYGEPGT